jgi:Xaa-Pro aminopeptidase
VGAAQTAVRGLSGDIAIEKRHLTVANLEILSRARARNHFIGGDDILEALRARKEPHEVEDHRRASAIADTAVTVGPS